MKLGVFLSLCLVASTAMAEVSVNVKCKITEFARGTSTRSTTDMVTLSTFGQQTMAVAPSLAMDRGAIYLLALAKGSTYTDALGDEVGADYFLTLSRVQNRNKQLTTKGIQGKTQDMLTMTEKEGVLESSSYRDDKGKLHLERPESLKLNYRLKGNKKVQVRCEII